MPTYEYRCKACGHELEARQRMSEDALRTCPACQKDELQRLISSGNFMLRGGGWFKDGYGASGSTGTRTENQRTDSLTKAISADKAKSGGE